MLQAAFVKAHCARQAEAKALEVQAMMASFASAASQEMLNLETSHNNANAVTSSRRLKLLADKDKLDTQAVREVRVLLDVCCQQCLMLQEGCHFFPVFSGILDWELGFPIFVQTSCQRILVLIDDHEGAVR